MDSFDELMKIMETLFGSHTQKHTYVCLGKQTSLADH